MRKIALNKGPIRDNAIKALVKSNVFRPKIERPKKGKGSYRRARGKEDGSGPSFYWS